MSSSRPDTAATKRDVDSEENIRKFICAREATTYDNLLLDGSISNADVRNDDGQSGLHRIPLIGSMNKDVDTDILISYLLTCDPPADVNGRTSYDEKSPMWYAAYYNNTSAVKVLIDFGGDRTIKTNSNVGSYSNMTPLDIAIHRNYQETIKLLTECFPSEE
jgi:ankyrin repeat protein